MFTLTITALFFLGLVSVGLVFAFADSGMAPQVPTHDPIMESIGLANAYARAVGIVYGPRNQRTRKAAFRAARNVGLTSDALRYLDARMLGAWGWRDTRGCWHTMLDVTDDPYLVKLTADPRAHGTSQEPRLKPRLLAHPFIRRAVLRALEAAPFALASQKQRPSGISY